MVFHRRPAGVEVGRTPGGTTFFDTLPRRQSSSTFCCIEPDPNHGSIDSNSTIFPKLQDCAHFHYDYVDIGSIHLSLYEKDRRGDAKSKDPNADGPSGGRDDTPSFDVLVVCGGKSWALRRALRHFLQLDRDLHTCIFDRSYSNLPDLGTIGGSTRRQALSFYLTRLSAIASDDVINCAPVLNWFEMDNKGHHLVAVSESSDLNTPAITAAFATKRYAAKTSQELSFEVGDIISIIDMDPKYGMDGQWSDTQPKKWWKGKRGFNVGHFPCHHVELLHENLMSAVAPYQEDDPAHNGRRSNQPPDNIHNRCSFLLDRSTISLGLLPTNGKWVSFLQTFFNSRPSKRKLRARGIYKERVYGCDLGEYLTNTDRSIPPILTRCCEWIEKYGVVDGIYRLSGISSNIQKIRNAFDDERVPDLDVIQDIHSISSALKMYFRELPNPLLTYQLYPAFVDAIDRDGDDVIVEALRGVVHRLPPPHYRTVLHLFNHLSFMAHNCHVTNMHPKNLAIVWAPNLLRSSREVVGDGTADSAANALHGASIQALVTEYLVKYAHDLFAPRLPTQPSRGHFVVGSEDGPRGVTMRHPSKQRQNHANASVQLTTFKGKSQGPPIEASIPGHRPKSMGPVVAAFDERKGALLGQFSDLPPNTSGTPHTTSSGPGQRPEAASASCRRATMEYMDICGGPSALPSSFHTVLELPTHGKRQDGRKKKRAVVTKKDLEITCHPGTYSERSHDLKSRDHGADATSATWLPLKPRNHIILSSQKYPNPKSYSSVPAYGATSDPIWGSQSSAMMSTSTTTVKLLDLPLSSDTFIDYPPVFTNLGAHQASPENFLKRSVMKHWRHKSDDSDLMVRRFRSNAVAPCHQNPWTEMTPPRAAHTPPTQGKLGGIAEAREDHKESSSLRLPQQQGRHARHFLKHTTKATNTENLSFPRVGKLIKGPRRASILAPGGTIDNSPKPIKCELFAGPDPPSRPTGDFDGEGDGVNFALGEEEGEEEDNFDESSLPEASFPRPERQNFYENCPVVAAAVVKPRGVDTWSQTEQEPALTPPTPLAQTPPTTLVLHERRFAPTKPGAAYPLRRASSDTMFPLEPLPPKLDFGVDRFQETPPHGEISDLDNSDHKIDVDQVPRRETISILPLADQNFVTRYTTQSLGNTAASGNSSDISITDPTIVSTGTDPDLGERGEESIPLPPDQDSESNQSPKYENLGYGHRVRTTTTAIIELKGPPPPRPPSPSNDHDFHDVFREGRSAQPLPSNYHHHSLPPHTCSDKQAVPVGESPPFNCPNLGFLGPVLRDNDRGLGIRDESTTEPSFNGRITTLARHRDVGKYHSELLYDLEKSSINTVGSRHTVVNCDGPSDPRTNILLLNGRDSSHNEENRDRHLGKEEEDGTTIANSALDTAINLLRKGHGRSGGGRPLSSRDYRPPPYDHVGKWGSGEPESYVTSGSYLVDSLPRRIRQRQTARPRTNLRLPPQASEPGTRSSRDERDEALTRVKIHSIPLRDTYYPPPDTMIAIRNDDDHPKFSNDNYNGLLYQPSNAAISAVEHNSKATVLDHVVRTSGGGSGTVGKLGRPGGGILKNGSTSPRLPHIADQVLGKTSNDYHVSGQYYAPNLDKPPPPPYKRRVGFVVNSPATRDQLPPGGDSGSAPINVRMLKDRFEPRDDSDHVTNYRAGSGRGERGRRPVRICGAEESNLSQEPGGMVPLPPTRSIFCGDKRLSTSANRRY